MSYGEKNKSSNLASDEKLPNFAVRRVRLKSWGEKGKQSCRGVSDVVGSVDA